MMQKSNAPGGVRGHLILRVDHEWPTAAAGHEDSVLGGDDVPGKTLGVPLTDLVLVPQDSNQTEIVTDGNAQLPTA